MNAWQPEVLLAKCPKALKEQMKTCYFKPGEYLFKIGDPARSVYILVEGDIKIYHATKSGIDVYPYIGLYNSEMLGELEAVLGGEQYIGSNVQAKTNVVAVKIPKDVFLQWLQADPQLNQIVMQRFARWIVMLGEYGVSSASLPLKVRMAMVLDEMNANKPGRLISKETVCGVLATSMRSTNRIVKQLKEEGMIAVNGDDIRILDLEKLRSLLQE